MSTGAAQLKIAQDVSSYVKVASRTRLSGYTQVQDLRCEPFHKSLAVIGHWMSIILVANSEVKVMFKVYFMSQYVNPFLNNIYGGKNRVHTSEEIKDFVKEFCNLTAGALKNAFSDQNIDSGLSLPVVSRGFDDLFSPASDNLSSFSDLWVISGGGGQLVCAAWTEVSEIGALAAFDWKLAESRLTAENEVEFL